MSELSRLKSVPDKLSLIIGEMEEDEDNAEALSKYIKKLNKLWEYIT
jgi:hypothetical protein